MIICAREVHVNSSKTVDSELMSFNRSTSHSKDQELATGAISFAWILLSIP